MRRLLIIAALLVAVPATAQVTVPAYRDSAGQLQESQGVVLLNIDGTTGGIPQRATSTSVAGSVTTANTYQSALASSATRKGCAIYNTSANAEMIYLGAPGSATAAASIPLPAGGSFNCGSFQGIVLTDQISITSATTGSTFVAVSQ